MSLDQPLKTFNFLSPNEVIFSACHRYPTTRYYKTGSRRPTTRFRSEAASTLIWGEGGG